VNSGLILAAILIYITGFIAMILTVYGLRKRTKTKLENELTRLETLKNLIISSQILTEMEKVKSLINNAALDDKYKKWNKRYKKIEKESIPNLTDKLLEIEGLIGEKNFKEASLGLARAELDIYYVKTDMELLLDSVKDITESEERNRNAVTKLKSLYREVVTKYTNNKNDYKEMTTSIDLQFENINKLFSAFERVMENNDYEEVGKIVHALDDLIKNIKVVIDEVPTVLLMSKMIIPKKITDLKALAMKMKKDGYNIEFMNLEYNIESAEKKLSDIIDRMKVLNLEDSIFELKTMLDYFESLYSDFDKEKQSKKEYEIYMDTIGVKLSRLTKVLKNIFLELEELKETYALTEDEIKNLEIINKELAGEKDSFKNINDRTLTKVTPYSRLAKECELISVRIAKTEDKLETVIKSLGSLKEDEVRAREQLTEIRTILKDAKNKIKEYKLPIIPKTYFIELEEAKEGIKTIIEELEKKPIIIKDLNTRVDTGRDLVLKLYTLTNELTKTAGMAEMAIVYGNRYRSSYKEIDINLEKAEKEFFKGDYRKSLEISLNALNLVEPGIHKKLMEAYKN
jgi:septation ring formation regulator